MIIDRSTPGHEHVVALDKHGTVIGFLMEIDTERMLGWQIGKVYDKEPGPTGVRFFEPVNPDDVRVGGKYSIDELHRGVRPIEISELLDRRTGKAWVADEDH